MCHIYPSLPPQSPPPLILSTGRWTRKGIGCWSYVFGEAFGSLFDTPRCRTISDARALAKWLEQYGTAEERK